MKVDVVPVAGAAAPPLADNTGVAVIDVLRATSTIITAIANGCIGLLPVGSPATARKEADRLAEKKPLLGGERRGLKIQGFDLGNNPTEYTPQTVAGRTIIFCTTNGTRALLRAAEACLILVTAFLNVSAVVDRISQETDLDWMIFCAGSRARFSWEDFTCAGIILQELELKEVTMEMGDGARAARELVRKTAGRGPGLLLGSHASYLRGLGLGGGVDFCASLDVFNLVPTYRGGWILPPHSIQYETGV